MSISMIGIDHSRASVDIRARFLSPKKRGERYGAFERRQGYLRCIILSTCNRMEIWASVQEDWEGSLLSFLCSEKEVLEEDCREYFITRRGKTRWSICFT